MVRLTRAPWRAPFRTVSNNFQRGGFFATFTYPGFTDSMSVEIARATVACGVCGARVTELRRGRCWGCYTRWGESRPVGKGAACAICHERRRSELRLMEL